MDTTTTAPVLSLATGLDLPTHPLTGDTAVAVIGGRPIYPLLGGAEDEDEDEGDTIDFDKGGKGEKPADDEDDDEGKKSDEDEDEEWTPPTKEEWEKTRKALADANGEAKTYRLKLRETRQAARAKAEEKQPGATDKVDKKEVAEAVAEAVAAAEKKLKPGLVRSTAVAGLIKLGLDPETPDPKLTKLLKTLDLDDIDVEDDGTIQGLDDQLAEIKDDFPELFERKPAADDKPRRKPAPRILPAGRKPAGETKKAMTSGERHAARLTKG